MKMKITGAKKLQKKLSDVERNARKAHRKSVRAGLTVLTAEVKSQVPVDEGNLKKATANKTYGKALRSGGVVGADVAKLKADDRRPSNIDHLVEYGHTTPDGTIIPPSGYMRRAEASGIPKAKKRMEQKMKEELLRGI